jgi:pimeloyl-ACP methyl ester carboxylesterase
MASRIEDRTGVPWSDFDIPTMVRRIAPPPLLTVHDPSDNQTRYADSVALAAAWPESRLVTTDNLNHWLVLRDPRTVEHAVSFASDRADLLE